MDMGINTLILGLVVIGKLGFKANHSIPPHTQSNIHKLQLTEIVGYVAPKLTWVELTDEEIEELANEYLFAEGDLGMLFVGGSVEFARAILRKAKEKNS